MSQDREDAGNTFIPERYRQQIAARKRRQNIKRLAAVLIVVVIGIAGVILVTGTGVFPTPASANGSATPAPTSFPITLVPLSTTTPSTVPITAVTTATPTPQLSIGTPAATPVSTPNGSSGPLLSPAVLAIVPDAHHISADQALVFIREDYPLPAYTVTSADIRDQPPAPVLYAFSLQPADSTVLPVTAYLTVETGDPYTPGQDSATVPIATARNTLADAFPGLRPDQTRIRFVPGGIPLWNFTLFKDAGPLLSGSLDAQTGLIRSFSRVVTDAGRPANPALDSAAAQKIADTYISDHDGPLAVNMSSVRYEHAGTAGSPVAGQYVLVYNRLVDGYPCDVEGFTFTVDSVSGAVTGYERRWDVPGFAFADSPVPAVLQRDATYTVLKKAQDLYPGLSSTINIQLADIRWKDDILAGTVPKPSAIPLAWKVVFDDELIRAMPAPVPAVAWVDVQSGNLIAIDYKH